MLVNPRSSADKEGKIAELFALNQSIGFAARFGVPGGIMPAPAQDALRKGKN